MNLQAVTLDDCCSDKAVSIHAEHEINLVAMTEMYYCLSKVILERVFH